LWSDLLFLVADVGEQVGLLGRLRGWSGRASGGRRSDDRTDGGPGRRRGRHDGHRLRRHGDGGAGTPGGRLLPRRLDGGRRPGPGWRCRRQNDVGMRPMMWLRAGDLVHRASQRQRSHSHLHSLQRRLRPRPEHTANTR